MNVFSFSSWEVVQSQIQRLEVCGNWMLGWIRRAQGFFYFIFSSSTKPSTYRMFLRSGMWIPSAQLLALLPVLLFSLMLVSMIFYCSSFLIMLWGFKTRNKNEGNNLHFLSLSWLFQADRNKILFLLLLFICLSYDSSRENVRLWYQRCINAASVWGGCESLFVWGCTHLRI